MGMFDDIECEYPLPDTDAEVVPDLAFQTKSLECYLGKYRIDGEGRLWEQTFRIEDRSDPTATDHRRFMGAMTRVPTGWEAVPLTGEVAFYDMIGEEWFEYSAYFADGALREIHRTHERR